MKVGSIKTYHNGSTYSVGDIFDLPVSQVADSAAAVLVHFTDNGLVDECGNEWQFYSGATLTDISSVPTLDATFTYNTATGDAFSAAGYKMSNIAGANASNYAVLNKDITLGGDESFMIDCWIRTISIASQSNSTLSRTCWALLNSSGQGFKASNMMIRAAKSTGTACARFNTFFGGTSSSHDYNFVTGVTKNSYMTGLRRYIFYYNAAQLYSYIFFHNGGSSVATWRTEGKQAAVTFNRLYIYGNGASVAELRIVKGRLDTPQPQTSGNWGYIPCPAAPSSYYSHVDGYIPIRHNNQIYYAPLSTAKNSPCLCVRHNNTNYYTVNS